jgi:two-component system chemotaxis response regulator CheB
VGHAYTAETLLEKQNDGLEEALWTALRVLEEQYSLSSRLAQRARDRNQNNLASRFEERARESEEHGATIRRILLNGSVGTDYLAARGKDEEDVNPNEENIKPSS